MDFRKITIPYQGREAYPSKGGGESVKTLISNYLGGSSSIVGGGGSSGGGNENRGGNATSFFCFLSKTYGTYSALDLAQGAITEVIQVTGYRGNEIAQTLVGDISKSAATATYDIQGISGTGISVSVSGNGTTGTTIRLTFNNTITGNSGTLEIPVAVNINDNQIDPYHAVWYDESNKCVQMNLQFAWAINRTATGSYVLDLSNQMAQVNCDADGVLYPASIATLHCTATTYFNGAIDTGVTYSANTHDMGVVGFTISASTGELFFTSGGTGKFYWNPNYPALPIDIIAMKDGTAIATKTMTISRNYPGSEGQPAVTRWIETDKDFIKYNPNTNQYSDTAVTGTVWKQVGSGMPSTDTACTICQWFDGRDYIGSSSSTGTFTAHIYNGDTTSGISFGLGYQGHWYEQEDVPIIFEGKNGGEGPQGPQGGTGPQGPQGQSGGAGESAYHMTLDNDNASINCDSNGNILTGAYRPSCRVKLYYGTERVTNPYYAVSMGTSTGVTTGVSDGILTIATSSSTFNFTGNTLVISITARTGGSNGTIRDTKQMTITKSIAGANGNTPYISGGTWWINGVDTGIQAEGSDGPQGPQGGNGNTPYIGPNGNWWIGDIDTGIKAEGQDAVSYWLALSGDEILLNPNDNSVVPSYVSATSYMQIGQQDPEPASGVTIKACWVRKLDGSELQESAKTLVNFTQQSFNNYAMLRFKLYHNDSGKRVDMEEVSMMTDGKNGSTGPQGPQGGTGPQGTNGQDGDSTWYLSLSNDNATINCDSAGTVLTGAYHPYTDCKLMYGMVQDTGAEIEIEVYDGSTFISNYANIGVSLTDLGSGTWRISTTSALQFTSTTLTIIATAKDSNYTDRDRKAFTISKSIAGANGENGEDATSYWLELNTQDMIYDRDNDNVSPSSISVTAWKQVGEDTPRTMTITGSSAAATVKYKRVFRDTGVEENGETTYSTSFSIPASSAETYSIIRFRLYVNGYQRDMEEVAILMNGTNGQDGTSIQGATIRGPYDYGQYSATSRCWCAGESGSTPCTDCSRWIDVMLKDGVYYQCVSAYNGTAAWGFSNNKWAAADAKFDFVAAGLILASGASINFLTNNELYLKDGDTITGGARGGSGYTFWAGEQLPENAPFRVDTNGSFSSTTGMIGGWSYNNSGLTWHGGGGGDDASYDSTFNRSGLSFDYDDTIRKAADFGVEGIHFSTEENLSDSTALYIGGDGVTPITFEGSGLFNCKKLIINSGDTNIRMYDSLDIHDNLTLGNGQYGVVRSLFNPGFNIAFITSSSTASSYFTRVTEYLVDSYSGGTWYFNNDMAVAEWNQNGGSGLYMVLTDSGMCREEVIVTLIEEAGNTCKTWRNGGSDDGYMIDVIQSGSTFYRCLYNYTGKLNWSSNSWRWTADTWSNIISNRYFYGDDMKKTIRANYPSANQVGLPYRYAGMWCACNTSSPTSSSRFIPTGIFGPNFTNKRGDTLYIEV